MKTVPLFSQQGFEACQRYSSGLDFEPPAEPDAECPECGSDNVKYDKYSFECKDCGYYDEADFEAMLERDDDTYEP